jgi:anti-sigma factor ChrR (cupin superfamily)
MSSRVGSGRIGSDSDAEWSGVFTALAKAMRPAELSSNERDRLYSQVTLRAQAQGPAGTVTQRAHEAGWRQLAVGVRMKLLRIDRAAGNQTALVRFDAGSSLESHPHSQEEECLVVEGEITIGNHRLRAGDMHVARPGTRHASVSSVHGALLLVRSDIFDGG